MPINIHGKEYVTVAERVIEAGKDLLCVSTEVLYQNPVVIKATVTTTKGIYSGISAANPNKTIEKQSPYEVAETSAVGRALGFAGYGIVTGIASAEEMTKAELSKDIPETTSQNDVVARAQANKTIAGKCPLHEVPMYFNKNGKKYHKEGDEFCNGYGFPNEIDQSSSSQGSEY